MSKFYGCIGFRESEETAPGVWTDEIKEYYYYGDLTRQSFRNQTTQKVNDDIVISNSLSIVADEYAYENFSNMLYVKHMGAKWKVNNVEVQHPRLIIQMGGVWNG